MSPGTPEEHALAVGEPGLGFLVASHIAPRSEAELPGCLAIAPAIVVLVCCALALVSGCGASALRQHATATVIATIAVESAEDIYLAHLEAASSGCQDAPCVLAARESHRPAEVAISLSRTAVGVYRAAVTLANEADESPGLLSALITAALRLAARWADVVSTLATLGIVVPSLPVAGAP